MCGIFGIIGDMPVDDALLERVADSLAHRGPDAQNFLRLPGVCFGHTLLSIIGTKPVDQPIRSRDGLGILTYNGEIYNYVELLRDDPALRAACEGRAATDTVVLVEGLRLYGEVFLQETNGMFAFGYHDLEKGDTLLVRDRLGIKPLFYARSPQSLVFASESRSVRMLSGQPFSPDPEAFYSYLRFRYPIGSRSFDRNIQQVLPGHRVRVTRDGSMESKRWWTNQRAGGFDGTYEEAVETTRDLLESSIELRMRSDHDFCTFLSGGLDSSLLTALASRNKPRLDTYSIGVSGNDAFDESTYAVAVANSLGTHHHPLEIGGETFRSHHADFVSRLEEPLPVPNQVALKALSEDVSRTHRVVLSGEGADEVFAGYGEIFLLPHDWAAMEKHRDTEGYFRERLVQRYGPELPRSFEELFIKRYAYTTHEFAVDALAPYFTDVDGAALRSSVEGDILEMAAAIDSDGPYNHLLVLFQNVHLPGLLYRVDAATMANSVEARVPFLDHRLVEFANTLPIDMKLRTLKPRSELVHLLAKEISEIYDVPKAILKDLGRGLLPNGIADRRKMGFPIPPAFYMPGIQQGLPSYRAWTERNLELWATSF